MLQMNVTVKNVSKATITPTLYVIAVSQGIFSVFNGQTSALIGVLTSNDILDSHKQTAHAMITYSEVRHINGGNFLSDLKDKLVSIWHRIKPYLSKGLDIAKVAAPLLGLGEDGGDDGGDDGGVRAYGVKAGARMSRKSLKHRMHR
jgi:hypothetical protein